MSIILSLKFMDILTAGGDRIKSFVNSLVFFLSSLAVLILGYFRCHFGGQGGWQGCTCGCAERERMRQWLCTPPASGQRALGRQAGAAIAGTRVQLWCSE